MLIALAWQQRPQKNSLVAKPLRLLALSLAAVEQIVSRVNGLNGSGEYFFRYDTSVYPSVHVATLVLASLIAILLLWQSMADRQDR